MPFFYEPVSTEEVTVSLDSLGYGEILTPKLNGFLESITLLGEGLFHVEFSLADSQLLFLKDVSASLPKTFFPRIQPSDHDNTPFLHGVERIACNERVLVKASGTPNSAFTARLVYSSG